MLLHNVGVCKGELLRWYCVPLRQRDKEIPQRNLRKANRSLTPKSNYMTQQEYITTYAPKFATQRTEHNANKLRKEIQTLCGCSTQEAVKTLIATFDEALKIRDKQTAITL